MWLRFSTRSACAVSAAASEVFVTSSTCVVHSQQIRFMCLKGYEPNVPACRALGVILHKVSRFCQASIDATFRVFKTQTTSGAPPSSSYSTPTPGTLCSPRSPRFCLSLLPSDKASAKTSAGPVIRPRRDLRRDLRRGLQGEEASTARRRTREERHRLRQELVAAASWS